MPDAKKIAIMYCSSEDNSIFQANIAKDAATAANLEYVEATVSDTSMIQQVTESLIGKVDAIYIPTDNMFQIDGIILNKENVLDYLEKTE